MSLDSVRSKLTGQILGEVGENYGLMKAFFPGRSVAQIKKKGLRENAKNPERVTQAILARKPIGTFTYIVVHS